MFVPSHYREPDSSWMVDIIRGNPLALMMSNGAAGEPPFATHLPVIPDPAMTGDWSERLSEATLLGHMNRDNPQWQALEDGAVVRIAFTGPHAYVSPTLYGVTPAAPTWNFTSVHVRGVVERIPSTEETLEVVKSTVRAFEADFGEGWDMAASIDYFRKIVPGVGAFRIMVRNVDGMFKLSQEQQPEVRDRVRKSFAGRECGRHQETAAYMSRLP